jgi:alpha-tubulin suppressor-like RCC1 family protein
MESLTPRGRASRTSSGSKRVFSTVSQSKLFALVAGLVVALVAAASGQVATPAFQPSSGIFSPSEGFSQFNVQVTCATPTATIRYTTNGAEPTTSSPVVANGGTITIKNNLTLKAKAWDGAAQSATAAATYYVAHAVAAGDFHTMAVDFTGKLMTWGKDDQGRLGHFLTPQSVPHVSMSSGVIDIDGGADDGATTPRAHSILLKDDGTVWCTGSPANGRLGNNSTTVGGTWVQTLTRNPVTSAIEPLGNICAVAAGNSSSYAVSQDGYVYSWGRNQPSAPRLGHGSSSDVDVLIATKVKTSASTVLDRVVAIAAGDAHAVALRDDGSVWAWGGNTVGQIGDGGGASAHREFAVQVHAGATNLPSQDSPLIGIVAIAAGASHTIAITSAGQVVGWGESSYGRLGNNYDSGTSNPERRPVYIPQFTGVQKIAAGGSTSLFIKTDGTLLACGANGQHQVGDGTTTHRGYPVRVKTSSGAFLTPNQPGDPTIVDAAVGVQHCIALTSTGSVFTWGLDTSGQLGDGSGGTTDTAYSTSSPSLPNLADHLSFVPIPSYRYVSAGSITQLILELHDSLGNPVSGLPILFSNPGDGAFRSADGNPTELTQIVATTNGSGQASVLYRASNTRGVIQSINIAVQPTPAWPSDRCPAMSTEFRTKQILQGTISTDPVSPSPTYVWETGPNITLGISGASASGPYEYLYTVGSTMDSPEPDLALGNYQTTSGAISVDASGLYVLKVRARTASTEPSASATFVFNCQFLRSELPPTNGLVARYNKGSSGIPQLGDISGFGNSLKDYWSAPNGPPAGTNHPAPPDEYLNGHGAINVNEYAYYRKVNTFADVDFTWNGGDGYSICAVVRLLRNPSIPSDVPLMTVAFASTSSAPGMGLPAYWVDSTAPSGHFCDLGNPTPTFSRFALDVPAVMSATGDGTGSGFWYNGWKERTSAPLGTRLNRLFVGGYTYDSTNAYRKLGANFILGEMLIYNRALTDAERARVESYLARKFDFDIVTDSDQDGLTNRQEVDLGTDPNKADTDGDGLLDGEEVATYSTDPLDFDSDNDELGDGQEVDIGTNPNNPVTNGTTPDRNRDSDGDGVTDSDESIAGSNPNDPASQPDPTKTFPLTITLQDRDLHDDGWSLYVQVAKSDTDPGIPEFVTTNKAAPTQIATKNQKVPIGKTLKFTIRRDEIQQSGGTDEYKVTFTPPSPLPEKTLFVKDPNNSLEEASLPYGSDGSPPETSSIQWLMCPATIKAKFIDRDDPTKRWVSAIDLPLNQPIYAGQKCGDMISWRVGGLETWTGAVFSWTAEGPENRSGPSGAGKYEWKIADGDADTAKDWLDWKPGRYDIKCQVTLAGVTAPTLKAEQRIGVRATDALVIGWINPEEVPLAVSSMPIDMLQTYPPDRQFSSAAQKVLTLCHLENISRGELLRPEVNAPMTFAEREYILNWLFKFGGNEIPPPTSFADEATLDAFLNIRTFYKLFNRFQIKYLLNDAGAAFGEAPIAIKCTTQIGSTKDPFFGTVPVLGIGIDFPGTQGDHEGDVVMKDNKVVHQTNDGSPDDHGVAVLNALMSPNKWNHIGSTISQGIDWEMRYRVLNQVYPTYYIYERKEDGRFDLQEIRAQAPNPRDNFNLNPYDPPALGPAPFVIE